MREKTPPPVELTVTEDPVTGTWTLTLAGHEIEIERAHGFIKIDGTLHSAPFVQGLQDVQELAGEPLAHLTRLLPTRAATPTPTREAEGQATPPPTRAMPPPAPVQREQHTPQRRAKRTTRASTPTPQQATKTEPSSEDEARTVLPTEHAASYLGLRPKTLETLRTRGGGPPFLKLGRRVVYRKSDLDTWLAAKVRRSTSDPGEQ